MAPVKAVLFDLDGTLIHSLPDLAESMSGLMERRGYQGFTEAETMRFFGKGAEHAVRAAFRTRGIELEGAALKAETAAFLDIYEPRASLKTHAFEGVMEALAVLKGRFRLAVVTNKPTAPAKSILGDLGLAEYFDPVLGGDWGGPRKPSGDALLKVLGELGFSPSAAIMVGDSDNDILAAKAAGVRCVAVTFGYSHCPVAELGADRVIGHFSELADVIGDFSR